MSNLKLAKEKLSQYEYIVTLNEAAMRNQLQDANNVIRDFIAKFDNPQFIAPELLNYLNKYDK